jgi:signal transduction histidine kinase
MKDQSVNDAQGLLEETRQQLDRMQQQVLSYGRDLADIYIQEKEKRQALEIANQKLAAVLDGMSDGFVVLDAQLRIEQINRAGVALLETSATALTGQVLSDVVAGQSVELFLDQLCRAEQTHVTEKILLKEPVQRTLRIEAVQLPGGGWGIVMHDITWEERLSNMRNEFLNIAAHELRTPLSGVIGFTSLLRELAEERNLDTDTQRIVNNILISSERMSNAVDELLGFAWVEQSEFAPERSTLEEVLRAAISSQQDLARERRIGLFLSVPQEMTPIYADLKMLETAFSNVIENGIFFNQPGGSVHVKARRRADGCEVTVQDTGVGIPQVDQNRVFDPFFQVDEHTTRRMEGLGLGLSIARKTILLHGGNIRLESKLNQGTTVEFVLPSYAEATDLSESERLVQELEQSRQELVRYRDSETIGHSLVERLQEQLEHAQAQSLAYAQDLANLYRRERSGAERLKANNAKLSHSDRLALMGQMAASVAHDLSNLVTPILGYSQLIIRRKGSIEPDLVDIAERILAASRRANLLLRQMVTLAGARSEEREAVDLNELVEETVRFLEIRFKHSRIGVRERLSQQQLMSYCNQVQVSQVLLNLMVNAIDAMKEGGTLTLKTDLYVSNGLSQVQLQISDTGSGIAPEYLSKIFEPFFTTKPENVGTGLGLSVSKEIIDEHDGQFLVKSEPGIGTTFTVRLPHFDEELITRELLA